MTTTKPTEHSIKKPLLIFFLLAYGITWGLSVFATKNFLPFKLPQLVMTLCSILLHYGPALAAIILVAVEGGGKSVKALLSGLGKWRVGLKWYLFIFLFPLATHLAAIGIDVLLGGKLPPFFDAKIVPGGNPLLLLPLVFLGVLFQAGLAEEIGWRGFALPRLQQRYSALVSSLILGVVWTFWHFHPENFASLWPITFWYLLMVISFTILITWVQNNTGASLLMAVLFHTANNVSDWIAPTFAVTTGANGLRPFIIQGVLTLATALVVIVIFGAKTLSRKKAD